MRMTGTTLAFVAAISALEGCQGAGPEGTDGTPTALASVERLNGRVAMVGFAAALLGEWLTGHGPAGQVLALLRWYLG